MVVEKSKSKGCLSFTYVSTVTAFITKNKVNYVRAVTGEVGGGCILMSVCGTVNGESVTMCLHIRHLFFLHV